MSMTEKGFLAKANKPHISARGFLEAHKEWLLEEKRAGIIKPILDKLEDNPEQVLKDVCETVLALMLARNMVDVKSVPATEEKTTNKLWKATIYYSGKDREPLMKGFDKLQEAQNWVDCRLTDGYLDCNAEIQFTKNKNVLFHSTRNEAWTRKFPKKKHPFSKTISRNSDMTLMSVRTSKVIFSRG